MKFAISSTKYPVKYLRIFGRLDLGEGRLIVTTKTRESQGNEVGRVSGMQAGKVRVLA